MKNIFYCLVIYITVFTFSVDAQWVQTYWTGNGGVACLAASGKNLFVGTWVAIEQPSGGAFLSTDNGTNWTFVGFSDTAVSALVISDTNLFAGTSGGAFLSTNDGTNWTFVGFSDTAVSALVISDTNLFAGTAAGVFLSSNNGTTWTAMNNGLTNSQISSFAISGANLFAGTFGGGIFHSTNNGLNWSAVNAGLTNSYIWTLAVSDTNLFAGTSGGIFLSTNNGTTWTSANTGLTNTIVPALAASGMNLIAGTSGGGVFLSTNNGTSWTAINDGLISTSVYELLVYDTNLFAGTEYQVWRRPLSEIITSIEETTNGSPSDFILEQNYPNPFNPSTKIKYSIPTSEFVKLKVYDVLGNEIETLVNEEKPAGSYEVEFDSHSGSVRNLTSGIYFYTLQIGNFVQTKKMILLK